MNRDMIINGETLIPDVSGSLFWPTRQTLIVADLHFEKGSRFASKGQLLPPYDTRATLAALENAVQTYRPKRIISLGDSIDDMNAAERIAADDVARIRYLTETQEWVWVAGNHDPSPPDLWGGVTVDELTDGPFVFRHQAINGNAPGEMSGHFHPKASISTRGRRVSARCFLEDGIRMILPSFGAYTGGLDVFDPAFTGLFSHQARVWLLGRGKLHRFEKNMLRRSKLTKKGRSP